VTVFLTIMTCVGLLGMTWLFPTLAIVTSRVNVFFKGRKKSCATKADSVRELSVLIPAHNEEEVIETTLLSISNAVAHAQAAFPKLNVRVVVGADRCSDGTVAKAKQWQCDVIELNQTDGGKWATLSRLVAECKSSDWIVLADAGVVWSSNFLSRTLRYCEHAEAIAVAPTYKNAEGGTLEGLIWSIERHFKSLESYAGGPVSVHGATVLYRSAELQDAFSQLSPTNWLNDDVVLPLYLRLKNPSKKIIYLPDIAVHDSPHRLTNTQELEFVRRRRIAMGNLQWIRMLANMIDRKNFNFTILLLSLRRVFRLFWAYWVVSLALIFVFSLAEMSSVLVSLAAASAVIVSGLIAYMIVPAVRTLLASVRASILAPYYFLAVNRYDGSRWR